jgi:hypothetical protein
MGIGESYEAPAAASGMWEAAMEARLRALHVQAVQAVQAARGPCGFRGPGGFRGRSAFQAIRCAAAIAITLLWCWAVFRIAGQPARSGPVEQGLAIGGWTLSLLPVHVAPRRPERPDQAVADGRAGAVALPTPRTPAARGRPFTDALPVSYADPQVAGDQQWARQRLARPVCCQSDHLALGHADIIPAAGGRAEWRGIPRPPASGRAQR